MNNTEILAKLAEMQEEIEALQQWKQSCNMVMAWWGGVCMLALSIGTAIANYYTEIKGYLITLWGLK